MEIEISIIIKEENKIIRFNAKTKRDFLIQIMSFIKKEINCNGKTE